MPIRRNPSQLTDTERQRLARLGEAARRSQRLHADDVAARDRALYDAEANSGNLRECARAAGMSIGAAHRAIINETARRQRESAADE